jgi:hypothetical protein
MQPQNPLLVYHTTAPYVHYLALFALAPASCTPHANLQVKNFRREVLSATIEPAAVACPGMSVVALRIKGTAFLWHQVRREYLRIKGTTFLWHQVRSKDSSPFT